MIREGQPIKCMDATILGIHLTTGIQGVYYVLCTGFLKIHFFRQIMFLGASFTLITVSSFVGNPVFYKKI